LGGEPGANDAALRAGERYGIGVDIGGTFTDCTVVSRGGAIYVGKVPTTRHALSEGFFGSIADAAARIGISVDELYRRSERLSHGTTVGINAIVTRTGAKIGLLATKGHGDAIRIMDNSGRITGVSIEEVLDYTRSKRPRQFVEREHIVEVTERLDSKGRVVVPLNEDEVRRGVARLLAGGVEAFAVSYLWGFLRPEHELRTAEIIRDYVKKGTQLFIEGKIQTRSWDDKDSGQKKYRTEILVNDMSLLGGGPGRGEGGGASSGGGYSRSNTASYDQRPPASQPDYADQGITDDDIHF